MPINTFLIQLSTESKFIIHVPQMTKLYVAIHRMIMIIFYQSVAIFFPNRMFTATQC